MKPKEKICIHPEKHILITTSLTRNSCHLLQSSCSQRYIPDSFRGRVDQEALAVSVSFQCVSVSLRSQDLSSLTISNAGFSSPGAKLHFSHTT